MTLHLFTSSLQEALLSYLEIVQTGVRGIVTDEKGEPLPNANIEISGIYYTDYIYDICIYMYIRNILYREEEEHYNLSLWGILETARTWKLLVW